MEEEADIVVEEVEEEVEVDGEGTEQWLLKI